MTALELLEHINPAGLAYQEWLAVGMALKDEGFTAADWDAWSRQDPRYKERDCFSRWDGFRGSATPVTAGTLVALAKAQGWTPPAAVRDPGRALDWDEVIHFKTEDKPVVDLDWLEERPVAAPDAWDPVAQIRTYLSTLFEAHEYVGYVAESYTDEAGKHLPKRGSYSRTAGELIQALSRYNSVEEALGDYDQAVGVWVRFNPLDGHGVADANVTRFRYCLVESDAESIERQAAFYRELELPVAVLVHSGNKSLHAIVRVDATSKEEYRERVNFLYDLCKKHGFPVDPNNKNPSRLSRLPGVQRGENRQFIVGINEGKESWAQWKEFIEQANDSLPDIEPIASVFGNPPPLADALIEGMLRKRHKMLVAGPSKAGKSFLLLQLAIAVAEGGDWIGFPCQQGRVLYVNLELDKASCINRIVTLYNTLGRAPRHLDALDVWHLRGSAAPLDKLAPKLIRRALKRDYTLVIIDPIYKVLTGSEKEAEDMALFCNQFDNICMQLGAATVYCHHHSKGQQGQKASIDRSSGSGVFARDPDAILDLIELNVPQAARETATDQEVRARLAGLLDTMLPDWRTVVPEDEQVTGKALRKAVAGLLSHEAMLTLSEAENAVRAVCEAQTGWRIEATLREFREFPPKHVWFRYPVHRVDETGILQDAHADGEEAPWEARKRDRRDAKGQGKKGTGDNPIHAVELAHANLAGLSGESSVPLSDLVDVAGLSMAAVEKAVANSGTLVKLAGGVITTRAAVLGGLTEALSSGKTLTEYAASAGVSERTIRRWQKT